MSSHNYSKGGNRMQKQGMGGFSRKRRLLAAAVAAGATAFAAAPAQAANVATCDFSIHVKLIGHGPTVAEVIGGTTQSRKTAFESDRVGRADCVGKVNDHTISGPGQATMSGEFLASPLCVHGVGRGSIQISAPRLLSFFQPSHEALEGKFDLDLSPASWRQLGTIADEAGETASFTALSRFSPDRGSGCAVQSGTLTGRIVIGGSYADHKVVLKSTR
jgi:hypothetical protein